ncbi:MAG: hypothetical protein HZA50_04320 [Planctomycetes bacterium]|nr:hypothetical protein [Planctomycetota bacterium]
MAGKRILLCVTGGIACYKSADLASALVRASCQVSAAMTDAARKFIQPLTFQTLTRRQVFTDMWQSSDDFSSQHIALTDWADLMIVAPATANIIAKMACGIADELVSCLALSAAGACPILIAPAMNDRMWSAPATRENMAKLVARGVHVVGPATGRLACGTTGTGRMAEPDEIFAAAAKITATKKKSR